jgi:hypothetical protein
MCADGPVVNTQCSLKTGAQPRPMRPTSAASSRRRRSTYSGGINTGAWWGGGWDPASFSHTSSWLSLHSTPTRASPAPSSDGEMALSPVASNTFGIIIQQHPKSGARTSSLASSQQGTGWSVPPPPARLLHLGPWVATVSEPEGAAAAGRRGQAQSPQRLCGPRAGCCRRRRR